MTDTLQHAALASTQREDVSAVAQIRCGGIGINRDANGCRAILRADTRGDTEARRRVDADRVGRAIRVLIGFGHRREAKLIDSLTSHCEADQAARPLDHEVDHLGRHELGAADQIAFVFAVLIVGNDDELAGVNVPQRVLN